MDGFGSNALEEEPKADEKTKMARFDKDDSDKDNSGMSKASQQELVS